MHTTMSVGGNRVAHRCAGLTQASVLPHLTYTAVDGLVFEELDVLFRSEDFFHTLEILATSLFLHLPARLALVYTE